MTNSYRRFWVRKKYRIIKCKGYITLHAVERKWLGIWWNADYGTLVECERYVKDALNPVVKEYS
jgi:hypothetical protein